MKYLPKYYKKYSLIICFLIQSSFVSALTLNEQRNIYAEAVKLQEHGLWQKAAQKSNIIVDYPLTYLLEYQYLKRHLSTDNLPVIQAFVENNSHHKVSNDLQRKYLYYLARNKKWSEYLKFYPSIPKSTSLKCYHFQAQINQDNAQHIWPEVKKTWLTGTSLPSACDPVLKYYFSNNQISQSLIWERFKLTYIKNQSSLLRYLTTLMDKPTKTLANQLLQLNKNPKKILTSNLFINDSQKHYSLLAPTIKKLSRKNIELGVKAYTLYNKKIGFNLLEQNSLKRYFISRILILDKSELIPWLDKELPYLKNDPLVERRIRYAIKLNNWDDIEYWIQQLSTTQKQNSKWIYWQARIFENKKQLDEANELYKKIANTRTYYGFLAAQKLDIDYQLNAQIVPEKLDSLDHLSEELYHIEELSFQKHIQLLRREWVALIDNNDTNLQRQLGLYAFNKGWPHLSVIASVRSKSWDALNIRFPEVKPKLFQYTADKYKIDPSYIYAITRQESSFDEFANSPAGAKGYMQLMPKTASETARKIGLNNYKNKKQLSEGKINLQLGSAYLNMLLKRYNGNRILATAAYNAGPHRVDRWTNGHLTGDKVTMDSWVETIPYKETRRYVKNVLAYNVIYQHILDKPLKFLTNKEINANFKQ